MRKFLKWVGITFIVILLIIMITLISLITLVDPNRFKPIITEKVQRYTGHMVQIKGNLSWTLFPYLGVKAEQIIVENPPGFQPEHLAEIKTTTIALRLLPLFHHKIQSSGITVEGLTLYLVTNKEGKNNWTLAPLPSNDHAIEDPSIHVSDKNYTPFILTIDTINLKNSQIFYRNEKTEQNYKFSNINFHFKDINLLAPFPLSGSLDFALPNFLSGKTKLNAEIAINFPAEIFALKNINLDNQILSTKKPFNFQLFGNLTANFHDNTLQMMPLKLTGEGVRIEGYLHAKNLTSSLDLSGQFNWQPMNIKNILQNLNYENEFIQSFNLDAGEFTLTGNKNSIRLIGHTKVTQLNIHHLELTNLKVPFVYQSQQLKLSPIEGIFYQGKLMGSLIFNHHINFQLSLKEFDVKPLLQNLLGPKSRLKFSGSGNFNLKGETSGNNAEEFIKNLEGQGDFNVVRGVLEGIDIPYFINMAYALIKKQPFPQPKGQTDFNQLSGHYTINHGVIENNDLLLMTAVSHTEGSGTIDLREQWIKYHLRTILNNGFLEYIDAIPINIEGPLNNPKVSLDAYELQKFLMHQKVKQVKDRIKEKIKNKKATDLLDHLFGQ